MIPSDHFVRFYNEVFKFLDQKNGLEDYYLEISRHQEFHCYKCFMEEGLEGMEKYWGHIRVEENCVMSSGINDGVRYSHMEKCPSLTKNLDNDAGLCEKYCLHCPGWVMPLATKCGFYFIKYLRGLDTAECYSAFSEDREKIEALKAEVTEKGFKYIFDNLDQAGTVEANKQIRKDGSWKKL